MEVTASQLMLSLSTPNCFFVGFLIDYGKSKGIVSIGEVKGLVTWGLSLVSFFSQRINKVVHNSLISTFEYTREVG